MSQNLHIVKYGISERTSKDEMPKIQNQNTIPVSDEPIEDEKCLTKKKKIILIVAIILFIAAAIGIIIYLNIPSSPESPPKAIPIIITKKLESEFELNNKVKEPYRINVQQKSEETIITNNVETSQFLWRETNYDIYIINETNSTEETQNFYNKTFTAAILISSQCIDTKSENCEPLQMIDLTKAARRNLRRLDEIPDLKDIPLPLCLFNITNNDVITSMKCPELMPTNIRQAMILDLYFFRPPAIKRPDKNGNNVTINISSKDGKNFINEKNGGICDVSDPFESFCTTEMNTTTDLQGNVLSYNEIAFTNITHDENNSYIKYKATNLKDETEKLNNLDIKAYEEALNTLIEKINPYLKYYEEFSTENFKELYKVSKNLTDEDETIQSRRNLKEEKSEGSESEKELFHYRHYSDINLFINLMNDPGYISDMLKASLNFMVNEDKREITGASENSNFNYIIKSLRDLSNAGNEEATKLYNSIKFYLDNLDDAIYDNITSLINFIVDEEKKSLSFIFDATLNMDELNIFPLQLVQESANLKNNLNNIYNNIKNGGIKSKLNILNEDIYTFLPTSHKLLDNVFQNVRSLSRLLKSSKSKLTEIATYYLNHTSNSFSETAEKIQSLLVNYYINEDDLINTAVDYLIGNFTNNLNKAIEKEKNYTDNLLENLEKNYANISIENGSDEDKDLLISNLKDSKEIINFIIEKVRELIKKEMNLKDNGHFMTNYEISSINNSYAPDVKETYETIQILDNDETIDKIFDKTYGDFRENITKVMKSEKKEIQKNMVFLDDTLEEGLFSVDYKNTSQNRISDLGIKITDSIRNENDDYVKNASAEIKSYIEDNNEVLKELINNLTSILSEDSITKYADLFDKAFDSSFNQINQDIEKNKNLANNYFSKLSNIFNNDLEIIENLKNFETDEAHLPYYLYYWSSTHYVYFTSFYDIIKSKSKTQAYINKYKKFKERLELSREYINQELQLDMKYEYKNTITKLKELLQIMKNSKLSDRFSSYEELKLIDNNVQNLDKIYVIINKYFSDEIYNKKYLPKINSLKANMIKKIDEIDTNIEYNHKLINRFKTVNDYSNDFCFAFLRKKTYTCTNGVIYHPDSSSNYCDILRGQDKNYNSLISLSIYSDANLQKFISSFNKFYSKINSTVTSYTTLVNDLSQKLYNYEHKAISTTSITGYLKEYEDLVKEILSKNYGNNLISSTYDFYRKDAEERINKIFEQVIIDWKELFTNLNIEVNNNLEKYKNSVTEFGIISIIYYNYLYSNISESYYELMTGHEKREFNYTISYYYSYLIKLLNSEREKIINKIPVNNIGFERVLEQRKNEVNKKFDEINKIILDSKNKDLSNYNQLYLLQVPETNFFNLANLLSDFKKQFKSACEGLTYTIYGLDNLKENDLYSYISRFYKENSENGKEINEFFNDLDNVNFIYLELDKFKELIINNWVFGRDDFIKSLNNTLLSNNAQISSELTTKKKSYKKSLENEIIKYERFTQENIIFKISDLYRNSIKELNKNDIKTIGDDVKEIVSRMVYYLSKETEMLLKTDTSYYNDTSVIEQTIKNYKEKIFENIDNKIQEFVNNQKELLEKEVYSNYYKKYLDEYLYYVKLETEIYKDFILLNSSYNIGKIINKISEELTEEYGNKAKYHIIQKSIEYYEDMFDLLDLNETKKYINTKIDKEYDKLLSALKNKAIIDIKNVGSTKYDLSDEIKTEIDNLIKTKSNTINTIINSLKGNRYNNIDIKNITEWEIPDFSKISATVHSIKTSFDSFINSQKKYENTLTKNCIQQVIYMNFYDLLNNLIPSFGNEFFQRIISYNENFKIKYLYNNLGWSVSSSISYLEILDAINGIDQITKDLKIKLYRMNDLDSQILEKNKIILNLLNQKVADFIFDSRNYIIERYREFLFLDANIDMAFSKEIIALIKSVFESGTTEMQLEYDNIIEKYLKEKLVSSYKLILEEKTEEILRVISSQREYLKIQLDDIRSIDSDEVLEEINIKLNETSDALDEYFDHFNGFKISEELIKFLYNYGDDEIHPLCEKFKTLVDNLYKNIIIENLDKNCEDYENSYNYEKFNDIRENTMEEIKNNYIDSIIESSHSYSDNYYENLESKIQDIARRRLDEEYIRIMPDKSLDETFHKLLNNSLNLKQFLLTLEKFEEFDKKISDGLNNLNSSHKESLKLIADNNYTQDIKQSLEDRLNNLKNHSAEYYANINESFYALKTYLNESINIINELLNDCISSTIEAFEKKYSEILQQVRPINTSIDENIVLFKDSSTVKTQNYQFTVNTEIQNVKKEANFFYNYKFEKNNINGLKMPEVNININNINRPEKVSFNIEKEITSCAKEIENIEIIFNKANFSISLDFNPNSQNIISSISGLFDDYEYTVERYNTSDTKELICVGNDYNTMKICVPGKCSNSRDQTLIPKYKEIIEKKVLKDSFPIPE